MELHLNYSEYPNIWYLFSVNICTFRSIEQNLFFIFANKFLFFAFRINLSQICIWKVYKCNIPYNVCFRIQLYSRYSCAHVWLCWKLIQKMSSNIVCIWILIRITRCRGSLTRHILPYKLRYELPITSFNLMPPSFVF